MDVSGFTIHLSWASQKFGEILNLIPIAINIKKKENSSKRRMITANPNKEAGYISYFCWPDPPPSLCWTDRTPAGGGNKTSMNLWIYDYHHLYTSVVYISIYIYIYIHTHAFTYVCVHVCVCLLYISIYIYIYVCVCVFAYVCVCTSLSLSPSSYITIK